MHSLIGRIELSSIKEKEQDTIRRHSEALFAMRSNRLVIILVSSVASTLLAACATPAHRTPLTYQMIDRPAESRIELHYRNDTKHTKCLTASFWPNAAGKVYQTGDRVALIVDGRSFPIKQFNKGPCVVVEYTCVARVAPGKEIVGSIPYEEFGLPASLRDKPKTLYFSPLAPACH